MGKAQLSVRISEAIKQQVTRYLTTHGVTMDRLVEQALLEHLGLARRDEHPAFETGRS